MLVERFLAGLWYSIGLVNRMSQVQADGSIVAVNSYCKFLIAVSGSNRAGGKAFAALK